MPNSVLRCSRTALAVPTCCFGGPASCQGGVSELSNRAVQSRRAFIADRSASTPATCLHHDRTCWYLAQHTVVGPVSFAQWHYCELLRPSVPPCPTCSFQRPFACSPQGSCSSEGSAAFRSRAVHHHDAFVKHRAAHQPARQGAQRACQSGRRPRARAAQHVWGGDTLAAGAGPRSRARAARTGAA